MRFLSIATGRRQTGYRLLKKKTPVLSCLGFPLQGNRAEHRKYSNLLIGSLENTFYFSSVTIVSFH